MSSTHDTAAAGPPATVATHDFSHAVKGEWRPVRTSPLYAVSLFLVAVVVAMLPVLYLAMTAGVAYGIYALFAHAFPGPGESGAAWKIPLIIAAAIMGTAMVLFMLKPVFAPPGEEPDVFSLHPGEEPRLFAFVDTICRTIGAPTPVRIDVLPDVNAAAGFRRGWVSMLSSGDLVLHVGVPLATGLTANQFAGVVAHELGHFSQGAAMRAGYVVSTIQGWLLRVAYDPDAWDERLAEWQRRLNTPDTEDSTVALVAGLAGLLVGVFRMGVFVTRLILMVFFWVSYALSSHLARQMEFSADTAMARLIGSEGLASTARRIDELAAAFPLAVREVSDFYARSMPRELPDNLPALVADHSTRLRPEDLEKLELERRAERKRLFDSHPPTASRIAFAHKLAEPGIFDCPMPAAQLFSNIDAAALKATYAFYKADMGGFLYDATLVPTKRLLAPRQKEAERRKAITAYIGFEPPTWRPLLPGIAALPKAVDAKVLAAKLKQAREKLRACAPGAIKAVPVFREATEKQQRAEVVAGLMDAGLPVDYKRFGVPAVGRRGVSEFAQRCRDESIPATEAIDDALEAGQGRVAAALGLLKVPGIESRVPDAEKKRVRVQQLLTMLEAMRGMMPQAREMRQDMALAEALVRAVEKDKHVDKMKEKVRPLGDRIRDRLSALRESGGGTPYPYDDAGGSSNLGQRLVGATPGWREFGEIFSAGDRFVHRFTEDLWRGSAEIVDIARTVEKAVVSKSAATGDGAGTKGEAGVRAEGELPAWW